MGDDELEMREKYPLAADLIESTVNIICLTYPLTVTAPAHDVAGRILKLFFYEED